MAQMAEELEEDTSVAIFRVKLFLARTDLTEVMSQPEFQMATKPPVKDILLDITNLPIPVKKHLIISGIVQGKIFESSDAFARLCGDPGFKAKFPGNTSAHIYIKGPHHQSLVWAVDTVEMLLDEIVKQKNTPVPKIPARERYWPEMRQVDYEIKDFPMAFIKNVIAKGIIRGHLTEVSGAVVSTRGSPYLANTPRTERSFYLLIQAPNYQSTLRAVVSTRGSPYLANTPRTERSLYLLIQAPNHQSTLLAIQAINRLILEVELEEYLPPGEMLPNNSGMQGTVVKQSASSSSTSTAMPVVSNALPPETTGVTAAATEQTSLSDVIRQLQQYIKSEGASAAEDQMKQNLMIAPATVSTTPQPAVNEEQLNLDVPGAPSGVEVLDYNLNLYLPLKYKKEFLKQKKEAEGTWIPQNEWKKLKNLKKKGKGTPVSNEVAESKDKEKPLSKRILPEDQIPETATSESVKRQKRWDLHLEDYKEVGGAVVIASEAYRHIGRIEGTSSSGGQMEQSTAPVSALPTMYSTQPSQSTAADTPLTDIIQQLQQTNMAPDSSSQVSNSVRF